jgi:hypothetical protein
MKRYLLLLSLLLICHAGFGSATNAYVTPTGAATGNCPAGTGAAPNFTAAQFNTSGNWGAGSGQIGAGTSVLICGTFTGSAGATILAAQGSGSSGNPITLLFDTGSVIQTPYCSGSNGCLDIHGLSYIVVNGQNHGTIQNTANGDGLANQQISIGIYAYTCTTCTIENLTIANIYIAIQNYSSPLGGAATQMNAIAINGTNNTVSGNTIHDCGWCIYDQYQNGDTNMVVSGNNIYNWDHGIMFAASGAYSCTAPCYTQTGNLIHDNVNWETTGCVYHLDGLHTFGTSGSTMDGVYLYNDYFYGSLSGPCSSGFVFIEGGGSSTPSNMKNFYMYNEVGIATGADGTNSNGWFGLFSASQSMTVVNNTLLYDNANDNTACWALGGKSGGNVVNNLTFENNTLNGCAGGVWITQAGALSGTTTIDYNFYGDSCVQNNNCFQWNGGSFSGSFSAWKSACSCDAHSLTSTYAGALLNSNGSPQSGSPVIGAGTNLTSTATGLLASLQQDTTLGGTRSVFTRPSSGAWDIGAYQFGSSAPAPAPWFFSMLLNNDVIDFSATAY